MFQAQDAFDGYGIPFSESCWVYAEGQVNLAEHRSFLEPLILDGKIDTLHTWGDYPDGGFLRKDAEMACFEHGDLLSHLVAWTAHGGYNDLQNLFPLGLGDDPRTPHYHMDFLTKLGINYFSRNTDIDVTRPARKVLHDSFFRRFRGPTKAQIYSVTLDHLPLHLAMAEKKRFLHRSPHDVVLYTHFYHRQEGGVHSQSYPISEFTVSDRIDGCLSKLAERRDRGELEILRLRELLDDLRHS